MSQITWNWMFVNYSGYRCVVYYYANYLGKYDLHHITMPIFIDAFVFRENYSLTDFVVDNWKRTLDFGFGDTLEPQEKYNAIVDKLIQDSAPRSEKDI